MVTNAVCQVERIGYLPPPGLPAPPRQKGGFCAILALALSPTPPPHSLSFHGAPTACPRPGWGHLAWGSLAFPTWKAEEAAGSRRGSSVAV